jgi:ribosomal-protein-alanine N-acetyltransferase
VTGPFSEIIVRPMLVADIDQVFAIDVQSFALPWSSRSFRYEVTENQASRPWVAEWTGENGGVQVVGMLVLWIILDEGHIGTFAVHPDFRRHGIGRRLMARGLVDAFERGVSIIFLEVRRGNLPAQALYKEFGFELDGIRPHYYKDNNEDALLLGLRNIQPEKLQHLLE